ncbi:MAG: TonB-dependent receptor [Geminicoccaceae bacterium]
MAELKSRYLRRLTLVTLALFTWKPLESRAEEPCLGSDGKPAPAVAHLVSMIGDVKVDGRPPAGGLPNAVICPGEAVTVGPNSRAAVYLIGADTPLRLDENTVSRFEPPPEPGSGVIDLLQGAVYFLSEVRRTLSIRTPYVNAGIEGTEVYLRVGRPGEPVAPSAELIVLEGKVAVTPGERRINGFPTGKVTTGERLVVAESGNPDVTAIPGNGAVYSPLRQVTVGQLSWTLFYPDVMVATEAGPYPRITAAARLLAAGQRTAAETMLAAVPDAGTEAGLKNSLLAMVAVARKDAPEALRLANQAASLAPTAAAPQLALSYARQLAQDLDGAVQAAEQAAVRAPEEPLVPARLSELFLMRGDTGAARRAAEEAARLGDTPLSDIVLGYADLATYRASSAEAAFRRALERQSQDPAALLGLGLALIRQGDMRAGTVQLENAVVADPSSSLLRSYLGKAFFTERNDKSAAKQYAIAKELDPTDPTPWFYNAILQQLSNQPVSALRELERSMTLNDGRAPFRSALLLDRDQAVRGASLAQIYQDLGFTQLGINAAGRSLMLDPASSAAHRFLSDVYQGQPRLEVARVSELLQAQILQPVGLNPVQPSLAFSDLNVIGNAGPAQVGFNEFTPLFQKDGWQFAGTGMVGTQDTRAVESTATTLQGRTSLSIGQYFYDTDGFRQNDHLQHKIYTAFGQIQLTDDVSVQAEFRRRESNLGDRSMNFDLESFDPTLDQSVDQDIARLGGTWAITPATKAVVSAAYSNRNQRDHSNTSLDIGGQLFEAEFRDKANSTGKQLESQLLTSTGPTKIVAGGGVYRVDAYLQSEETDTFAGETSQSDLFDDPNLNVDARKLYAYSYTRWPEPVIWTAGVGLESTDAPGRRESEPTPKLGVEYRATDWMSLRAAAFRTVKSQLVAQQTIEPTMVAGFNQLFDDFNGTKADQAGAGLDLRLGPDVSVGVEGIYRRLSPPRLDIGTDDTDVLLGDASETMAQGYFYWTATDRISVSLELHGDWFRQHQNGPDSRPQSINTLLAPLSVRYFAPNGFFAVAGVEYVNQMVNRKDGNGDETDETGDAWLVDASIGYRLPERHGIVSLEFNNLLNQSFHWQDDTFRSSEQQNRRFTPERAAMFRLSLNF